MHLLSVDIGSNNNNNNNDHSNRQDPAGSDLKGVTEEQGRRGLDWSDSTARQMKRDWSQHLWRPGTVSVYILTVDFNSVSHPLSLSIFPNWMYENQIVHNNKACF